MSELVTIAKALCFISSMPCLAYKVSCTFLFNARAHLPEGGRRQRMIRKWRGKKATHNKSLGVIWRWKHPLIFESEPCENRAINYWASPRNLISPIIKYAGEYGGKKDTIDENASLLSNPLHKLVLFHHQQKEFF